MLGIPSNRSKVAFSDKFRISPSFLSPIRLSKFKAVLNNKCELFKSDSSS